MALYHKTILLILTDLSIEIPQDVRFEVVDLPSHFETYDKNSDGKVSLLELTIVTGTKEIDAMGPFQAADTNSEFNIKTGANEARYFS